MQTILGAGGQIGEELARSLNQNYGGSLRLVSRNPRKVNDSDQLLAADLLDPEQTKQAIAGSDIIYFTAGLPIDSRIWLSHWPVMMQNVVAGCESAGAKLVYFDNTYMYAQTSDPQKEDAVFAPAGDKGRSRAQITGMLLDAMKEGRVEAMVCRAPEFYGPGKTQSITNSTVITPLLENKKARVFMRDDTLRSLIFTPDASRAMALLGNTSDAFGQTWHLPCDDSRLTYREFVKLAAEVFGVGDDYTVIKPWQHWLLSRFNRVIRETEELLPRYKCDNLFVSDKFKDRFRDFKVTSIRDGLQQIADERLS